MIWKIHHLLLSIAIVFDRFCCTLTQPDTCRIHKGAEFSFTWSFNDDASRISFQIEAETRPQLAWIGFGFSNHGSSTAHSMDNVEGSDVIIREGQKLLEYNLFNYSASGAVEEPEADQDLIDASVDNYNGNTIIKFTRPIRTDSDQELTIFEEGQIFWAIGSTSELWVGHASSDFVSVRLGDCLPDSFSDSSSDSSSGSSQGHSSTQEECGNCVLPHDAPGCDTRDIEKCVCDSLPECCFRNGFWFRECITVSTTICGCKEYGGQDRGIGLPPPVAGDIPGAVQSDVSSPDSDIPSWVGMYILPAEDHCHFPCGGCVTKIDINPGPSGKNPHAFYLYVELWRNLATENTGVGTGIIPNMDGPYLIIVNEIPVENGLMLSQKSGKGWQVHLQEDTSEIDFWIFYPLFNIPQLCNTTLPRVGTGSGDYVHPSLSSTAIPSPLINQIPPYTPAPLTVHHSPWTPPTPLTPPASPATPPTPLTPLTPGTPATSAIPVTPATPATPATPVTPATSVTPVTPVTSATEISSQTTVDPPSVEETSIVFKDTAITEDVPSSNSFKETTLTEEGSSSLPFKASPFVEEESLSFSFKGTPSIVSPVGPAPVGTIPPTYSDDIVPSVPPHCNIFSCSDEADEVCGTDGATYQNRCHLEKETCRTFGNTKLDCSRACPCQLDIGSYFFVTQGACIPQHNDILPEECLLTEQSVDICAYVCLEYSNCASFDFRPSQSGIVGLCCPSSLDITSEHFQNPCQSYQDYAHYNRLPPLPLSHDPQTDHSHSDQSQSDQSQSDVEQEDQTSSNSDSER